MMQTLNPNVKGDSFKNTFQTYDKDNNGTIDASEFKKLVESFGQQINDKDLKMILKESDIDSNGSLDFEEFKSFIIKLTFKKFETDKNGSKDVLDLNEF